MFFGNCSSQEQEIEKLKQQMSKLQEELNLKDDNFNKQLQSIKDDYDHLNYHNIV
jgi:hypothetical protein